ncbi:hypothetical protein UCRPC4_g00665 [Phaeomoniella chlamydospora]|uniref:Hyphal anastamosis-8 protein n=1 Tax=Phaeomoniella chlamydospora TaxID=158046 RepID=A0A0G2HI62_PHACM|nr:hypothetical protein UCRPC4_g00665 [Phaeomoniella chlamydospora]
MSDSESAPKPSDVGFGYIADNSASPPLKSALKTPGTAGRMLNPLSPTFREEQILEKEEEKTEAQNAKDLTVKFRVRVAKMVLRGVNFSCSLIVLAMLSTTLTIFNATKSLPTRSSLPAWASGTNPWAQILVLVVACISLAFAILIFYGYWRGGHKRAEKVAVYYTVFAVFFFAFSIIMWAVCALVLHNAKAGGKGQDLWGWSCKDNKRRQLFQDQVQYALVCRLQNWSLVCCVIEIVIEVITIAIYAVVFYRFWSKRKLRKSMDVRDKARTDLYLAQLRSQSAPNTPGFAMTPRSPYFPRNGDALSAAEAGQSYGAHTQYVDATSPASSSGSKPFQLQPPPIRIHNATPKPAQEGFDSAPLQSQKEERVNDHVDAAPGEQTYESVPIPGAYASPLTSPSFAPQQQGSFEGHMYGHSPGQAM